MSTFDIFIKGINPSRQDETDEIIQLASEYLKLEPAQVENLLNASGSNCLQRGVSEEIAKTYQLDLAKIGITSVYKPGVVASGLSLVSIETEAEAVNDLICPHCGHEHVLAEGQSKPVECEKCGVLIAKALDFKKQQAELEEIKANILKAQQTKEFFANKHNQEAAEEKRKNELERLALEELQKGKQQKKSTQYKSIAAFTGAVILVGGLSFAITSSLNKPDTAAEQNAKPAAASADTPVTDNTLPADAKAATPAGQGLSMQEGHDAANQLLNKVGLDADAMGNKSSAGSAPDPELENAINGAIDGTSNNSGDVLLADNPSSKPNTNNTSTHASIPSNSGVSDQALTTDSATQTASPASSGSDVNNQNAASLASVSNLDNSNGQSQINQEAATIIVNHGDNPIEWNRFISDGATTLATKNALSDAVRLANQINDMDRYTQTMNTLMGIAQKTKQNPIFEQILSALQTKINALAVDQQVQYFAKAGAMETSTIGTNNLLQQAEKTYATITEPESQLKALLHLAVNYHKAGNTETANRYFKLTNDLLKKISATDRQISTRSAVARAYYDAGSQSTALKWLTSTSPLANTLTGAARQELIESYAYTNNLQSSVDLIKATQPASQQDQLSLKAIEASLKSNLTSNALTIAKDLSDPLYKAIAYDQIASNGSPESLNLAEQNLSKIGNPADQAIVSSLIAKQYSRLSNQIKTKEFSEQATQLLEKTSTPNKDAVTSLISKNLARSMQINPAKALLSSIQSPAVKDQTNAEILKSVEIGTTLKLL